MEKATVEISYFECKDIITTSDEHDNGYIGDSDFVRSIRQFVDKIF